MPNMPIEIISSTARVHANRKKAIFWTFKRLTGLPGGICKEGIGVMRWEQREQVWKGIQLKMMNGVAGFN